MTAVATLTTREGPNPHGGLRQGRRKVAQFADASMPGRIQVL